MKPTLIILVVVLAAGFAFRGLNTGSTFADGYGDSYVDDAAARANAQNKLLIVDAMASWCGPCVRMDQDTWPDVEVHRWMRENAVFMQFDVDQARHLVDKFEIRSMPTIIAIRNDKEIGRIKGYRGPADIIAWMQDMKAASD